MIILGVAEVHPANHHKSYKKDERAEWSSAVLGLLGLQEKIPRYLLSFCSRQMHAKCRLEIILPRSRTLFCVRDIVFLQWERGC